VDDLHVDPRRLRRRDRLADRVEDPTRLVAHVRGIGAAVPPDWLQERVQLRRSREGSGRGEEPRGEPGGAGGEPLLQEPPHPGQLPVVGRAVIEAYRHRAQSVVADLHRGVHRGRGKAIHVLGESAGARLDPGSEAREILLKQPRAARRRGRDREAAMTDHLGGHPLEYLAFRRGRIGQREVGVGLHVDEAGRDDEAVHVERRAGGGPVPRRERYDDPVPDRDVGARRRRSGPVQDRAPPNDQIVHRACPPDPARRRPQRPDGT